LGKHLLKVAEALMSAPNDQILKNKNTDASQKAGKPLEDMLQLIDNGLIWN
jgi:hypothetical protein